MKGFAMLDIEKTACTSDVHAVWESAIGDRTDMILGHEGVGELVKDFKPGDRVLIPASPPTRTLWHLREVILSTPERPMARSRIVVIGRDLDAPSLSALFTGRSI